jgi:hypothetical protein
VSRDRLPFPSLPNRDSAACSPSSEDQRPTETVAIECYVVDKPALIGVMPEPASDVSASTSTGNLDFHVYNWLVFEDLTRFLPTNGVVYQGLRLQEFDRLQVNCATTVRSLVASG